MRQDFVDETEAYVKFAIITLLPIGILLDVLIWRWRKLANVLLYYELVSSFVLHGFVPYDFGDFH